jgi:hypothetical protein
MKRVNDILKMNREELELSIGATKKALELGKVQKKYDIGIYTNCNPHSLQNTYSKEAMFLEGDYFQKKANKVKDYLTYTLKKNYNHYDTQELYSKILQDKKLCYEKESKFLSHVKNYNEKLDNLTSKLGHSTSMAEAEANYQQLLSFHDTSLNIIHTEQKLVLEDFQVHMVGEYTE